MSDTAMPQMPTPEQMHDMLDKAIQRSVKGFDYVRAGTADVGLTPKSAEAIYYLTSLAKFDDRFVIPPAHREQAIEMLEFTGDKKGAAGFGSSNKPLRGM